LVAKPPRTGKRRRDGRPEVGIMVRLGFGSRGAPLTWSRVAAALGRMGQASLEAATAEGCTAGRTSIYLDDPIIFLHGTLPQRNEQLLVLLCTWASCGFKIAWHKTARGTCVRWIGIEFEFVEAEGTLIARIPKEYAAEVAQEACDLLRLQMIPVARLRQFAGKCGWIMNLITRARWTVNRLWAALKATGAGTAEGHDPRMQGSARTVPAAGRGLAQRRSGGQHHSLINVQQIAPALRWIAAFWGQPKLKLERKFGGTPTIATVEMILDASPWGLGGYLAAAGSGTPLQYFHEPLNHDDEVRMRAKIGSSDGQQAWEALCVLCALRLWLPLLRADQLVLRVRSDSVTALSVLSKLASASPVLNGIGAEMALTLESAQVCEVLASHIPGSLNKFADLLSRMAQPGASQALPPALRAARQKHLQVRGPDFWKVWHIAVADTSQAQPGASQAQPRRHGTQAQPPRERSRHAGAAAWAA
jgi:hypothetical protein